MDLVGWVFRELQEIDISSTRLFDFLKCFDRNQFPLKLHYCPPKATDPIEDVYEVCAYRG